MTIHLILGSIHVRRSFTLICFLSNPEQQRRHMLGGFECDDLSGLKKWDECVKSMCWETQAMCWATRKMCSATRAMCLATRAGGWRLRVSNEGCAWLRQSRERWDETFRDCLWERNGSLSRYANLHFFWICFALRISDSCEYFEKVLLCRKACGKWEAWKQVAIVNKAHVMETKRCLLRLIKKKGQRRLPKNISRLAFIKLIIFQKIYRVFKNYRQVHQPKLNATSRKNTFTE